jgi:hypothetical protein
MKNNSFFTSMRLALQAGVGLLAAIAMQQVSFGYETYQDISVGGGNCFACHGDFRGPTSTKGTVFPGGKNHEMHRNVANMGTACDLCHTGADRTIVYIGSSNGTTNNTGLGCSGCHVGAGLRKHHRNNGVNCSTSCHPIGNAPPAETVKPPYYGTLDTKANNPGNTALIAGTNENWSVGDFVGLDNDGNNLYDLADYAVGPFKILSLTKEGNDIRVTWQTAGGRTNTLQAAAGAAGAFSDVSSPVGIPGVGIVTTNVLHVGGATNLARFYRFRELVP